MAGRPRVWESNLVRQSAYRARKRHADANRAVVAAGAALVVVLAEERELAAFPVWAEYAARVRWRVVPGVW